MLQGNWALYTFVSDFQHNIVSTGDSRQKSRLHLAFGELGRSGCVAAWLDGERVQHGRHGEEEGSLGKVASRAYPGSQVSSASTGRFQRTKNSPPSVAKGVEPRVENVGVEHTIFQEALWDEVVRVGVHLCVARDRPVQEEQMSTCSMTTGVQKWAHHELAKIKDPFGMVYP